MGGPAGDFINLAVKVKVNSVLLGKLLFTVVVRRGAVVIVCISNCNSEPLEQKQK